MPALPFACLLVMLVTGCSTDSANFDDVGGSSPGGSSSGGSSSGGSSSGGPAAGGASSGGASAAGASTAGASMAGASSAGASMAGASSAGAPTAGGTSGGNGATAGTGATLSGQYPGDVGIENDPAVVWVENFEQASLSEFASRYQDVGGQNNMTFVAEVPSPSSGSAALRLRAGGGLGEATDFYKRFERGYERLFVRYYAKYQANAPFHHSGVWIGGYSPAQNYPSPKAGIKPNGDDRISVSFEPTGEGTNPRMDFYNYWMNMRSGPNAYWGNTLIHREDVVADGDAWMCIEIEIKLNPSPSSAAGGELALWKNDVEIIRFTDASPVGYWTWDKFCPQPAATGSECTDYPPDAGDPIEPLNLQWRNSAELQLNYFWPQNYNTDTAQHSDVFYDDMVIATQRVGCIR